MTSPIEGQVSKCVGNFRSDSTREFCTLHDRWKSQCDTKEAWQELSKRDERIKSLEKDNAVFQEMRDQAEHMLRYETLPKIAQLEKENLLLQTNNCLFAHRQGKTDFYTKEQYHELEQELDAVKLEKRHCADILQSIPERMVGLYRTPGFNIGDVHEHLTRMIAEFLSKHQGKP